MNPARLALFSLLLTTSALAQAPQLLGYQGRLLQASGTPVSGMKDVRFTLYSADTAGTQLWTETQQLGLSDGFYSTWLGATGATAGTNLEQALASGTAWLELAFKDSGASTFEVLAPRQRVGSVAYALNAKNVAGGRVDATSVQINGTTVIDSSGNLAGPAAFRADAGSGLVTSGSSVSLQTCTSAGDWLRWSGSGWACATTPLVSLTANAPLSVTTGSAPVLSVALASGASVGVVRGGTGLSVDAGVASVLYGESAGTAAPGEVFIRSPLTLTVGPTGQYPDLIAAMTFLNTRFLIAPVTLQLQNGTHASASAITISHPQGELITVRGDPSNAANVVISVPQNASGIVVNGGRLGNITGVTLTTSAMSTGGAGIFSESGADVRVDASVRVQNFAYGLAANGSSVIVANGVQVSRPGGGAGSAGFQSAYSAHVYAINARATGYSFGFHAIYGASLEATGATATGGAYGFASQWNSMLIASNTTASGQSSNGHYAATNSTVIATNATSGSFNPPVNTSGNNNGFMGP